MINFADITQKAEELLKNSPDIAATGFIIKRNAVVNSDPGNTPWIGIYRDKVSYDTQVMGRGAKNWRTTIDMKILIQASAAYEESGAEDRLEKYIKMVVDALETDRTIGGTVSMINGYDIEYSFDSEVPGQMFFQNAVITVTMETRQ